MEIAPDIASIAGLMGDPVRAAILAALMGGRALPAGELAFIGNVAPQTASFHLRKMVEGCLISVERQGKHCYYRLASEAVAEALESLAALCPQSDKPHEREAVRELRFARSCYKHLAGTLAVEINQGMLARNLIVANGDRSYRLTSEGREWCGSLGVHLSGSARQRENAGRACLDWTERRHHLGGALGVALFSCLKELGWMVANPNNRAVRVTHTGVRELTRQFTGILFPRQP
jgi:DNA-binding transcriptional ArsR family regulator